MNVCANCGYALNVKPLAILVDGRVELELPLCSPCRLAVLEAARRPER